MALVSQNWLASFKAEIKFGVQFSAFYSKCLCEGVRCGAGGTCREGHCVCTEGWNGEHCADVDECSESNGG